MSREPLVLLPGMMCDARLFQPQIEAFQPDYKILIPEFKQSSIEQMAHSALQLSNAEKLNIAGLSMGGIVAMEMAKIAPERIARLALLDTNHLADAPGRHEIRNRQIENVKEGRLREIIIEEMKPVYLAESNRDNPKLLDLLIDMAMDCGPEMFISQSIALRDRPDQSDTLERLQGPVLVLCGEEDTLCPVARHVQIASLVKNSKLAIIPSAGHISTLENPAAVISAFSEWLEMPFEL